MRLVVPVLAVLAVGCSGDEELPIPAECNGAVELCARRYDEVVYPTTRLLSAKVRAFVDLIASTCDWAFVRM